MSEIEHTRRTSFDQRAERYDAMRPGYPAAAIDDVLARSGARRALEVGAGTGKATVLFGQRGLEIVALEPGARLAALLRERVRGLAVEVRETTFEACELTGFDLVYAAQAFHWVDSAVRYAKAADALRPGGALAILTNENAAWEPALRKDLEAAYARWLGWPAWDPMHVPNTEAKWTREIEASGRFGPVHVARFPWQVSHTSEQYIALIDTYSDHATQPDAKRLPLYDDIRAAIDRHGGRIELSYVTLEFFALRL